MASIRLALAQINPTVGDLDGNRRRIEQAIRRARSQGAALVALPELAVTGYPPEDLVLRPAFVAANRAALAALAPLATGITAVVGFVDLVDGLLYNAAAVLADGRVAAVYNKHLLPNYGVFDEKRYFVAGTDVVLGDLPGLRYGVTICEDLWSPTGPHLASAAAGAGLIININGSPYHRGKGHERRDLLITRALQVNAAFAYVNMVGGQDELVFDGQSRVVAADGTVLGQAGQFREELLVVDLPLPAGPGTIAAGPAGPMAAEMDATEEVYQALVTGVADYLGKNGFQGACIGLSGGIDSALTAAIAADAIGPANVLGVLMPSDYTSGESNEYALALAAKLGIDTITLPIRAPFEALLATLAPAFAGAPADLTEENLQSRVRGTLLMAISNKTGRMVLSTGNKSEMSTGYATLYGDMAGGFAVLKDVPKTLVFELCRWRNRTGEVIPQEVIDRPPTAELRANQLDTDSLPAYEILDPIVAAYVEEDATPEQIIAAGYPAEVVRRVVAMVDRAEYKRRQAPPGVKITRRAFGRDRRPPITNRYVP